MDAAAWSSVDHRASSSTASRPRKSAARRPNARAADTIQSFDIQRFWRTGSGDPPCVDRDWEICGRYGGSDPPSGGHHSSARAPPPPLVLIRSGERRCVVNRPAGGKITPPHILRRRREVIASISRLGAAKGASRFTLNKNTDRVTIDIDCGRRTCHYHGRGDTACSICRILPPSF